MGRKRIDIEPGDYLNAGVRLACVDPQFRARDVERFQRMRKNHWLEEARRKSAEAEQRLLESKRRGAEAEEAEKARALAAHREKVERAEAAGIGGWSRR